MQVLLTWKSEGLPDIEVSQHWTHTIETWKNNYQPLVDHELKVATTHTGTLFLGLLYIPEMFLDWQEFYEDDSHAVAWCGISHNLLDTIPHQRVDLINPAFVSQLQDIGNSFLHKLDGHFVVSVLNHKACSLQIFTNSFGLAPCFKTEGKYGIAVGTRIAPLLELVGGKHIPNYQAIAQVFVMDWCLSTDTTFEGVFQVKPGSELLLKEQEPVLKERSYSSPQDILELAKTLSREDYLAIGSDAFNMAIRRQMRHSKAPLMDLTGGMDTRAIVASAFALGYHPECDITGVAHSQEMRIASKVAETMNIPLHRIYTEKQYTENINETLRLWSLWTEGMIPAHIWFPQSAFALSPKLRKFFGRYHQIFCGAGGGTGRGGYYTNEMLVRNFSPDEIVTELFKQAYKRYSEPFLTSQEMIYIRDEIQRTINEGIQLGLSGHKLMDYYYWQQRSICWGGYMVDTLQLGRYVFVPLCQTLLTAVFFSMTVEEHLSGAWHQYHIQRMVPSLSAIPFLHPPSLSGLQKFIFDLHPTLFKIGWYIKPTKLFKRRYMWDKEKMGTYFHSYVRNLLFSGDEWWPNVIHYEKGRKIWDNFVRGKEADPLWNLVTFELWAKNFLT